MNRSLVAGLVLVVLLAGCSAPADSTPSSTLTPVDVPETPDRSDRLASGEFAPGVDDSGVTDPGRLARAHADVLSRSSYTVNQTLSQTYANGTVKSKYVTDARFASAPGTFTANATQTDRFDGTHTTRYVERFADGERVYERVTEADETRYGIVRTGDGRPRDPLAMYPRNLTNSQAIARLFRLVETNTTDRWVENGTRYVRVQSRQEPPLSDLPPLQNVTIQATVAESGLVTSYRVEYDVARDDTAVHVVVAVTYDDVGETAVRPPMWLDRVNATD